MKRLMLMTFLMVCPVAFADVAPEPTATPTPGTGTPADDEGGCNTSPGQESSLVALVLVGSALLLRRR